MSFGEKISNIKHLTGLEFDDNLYSSVLICAASKRHLLVPSTNPVLTRHELAMIGRSIWGIKEAISIVCSADTTVKQLTESFIYGDKFLKRFVVLSGLEKTSVHVQASLLEILRHKKITINNKEYNATEELFTVILVIDDDNESKTELFKYLKDHLLFKQVHVPQAQTWQVPPKPQKIYTDLYEDLKELRVKAFQVTIMPDVKRYMRDIIVFLRMHRAVSGGIAPITSIEFEILLRYMCAFRNYDFASPTFVQVSALIYFPLRLKMVAPDEETSLAWGSDPELVGEMLKRWSPELIIEDVINKVAPPL